MSKCLWSRWKSYSPPHPLGLLWFADAREIQPTISSIIFSHFLIFYQIFLSPQVKRWTIITYKHGIYELSHELLNDLRLRKVQSYGSFAKFKATANKLSQARPHPPRHEGIRPPWAAIKSARINQEKEWQQKS